MASLGQEKKPPFCETLAGSMKASLESVKETKVKRDTTKGSQGQSRVYAGGVRGHEQGMPADGMVLLMFLESFSYLLFLCVPSV